MTRLNIVLLLVTIVCALSVITSQHNARKRYSELQKEQKLAHELDIEWDRLRLEQGTWAMHGRVETEAIRQLNMEVPTHHRINIVLPAKAGEHR